MESKMYKVLTHHVVMEKFEIPAKDFEKCKQTYKEMYKRKELEFDLTDVQILERCLNEDYLIKSDSRDFEIVDFDEVPIDTVIHFWDADSFARIVNCEHDFWLEHRINNEWKRTKYMNEEEVEVIKSRHNTKEVKNG